MKILIIHQYYLGEGEGGGSRFNQFVKYWAKKGHDIIVIAGTVHYATGEKPKRYKGKYLLKEQDGKATIYRTYVYGRYNASFWGRLWGYFSFMLSSLWAGLFVRKPDIILVTSPPLFVGITGLVLSKLKKAPFIFEIRDLWPESAIDLGILKNDLIIRWTYVMEKFIYKKASLINVLTPAFKDHLVKKKSVPPDKILMIPNGADLDIFYPGEKQNQVRKQYGLNDKFIIVYIGAHGIANGLIYLIDVAEKLRKNNDIVLMLVGDGMEKPLLKREVKNRKLNNVVFVDSQPKEKVVHFCNAADVCTAVLKKAETFKTVYPNKVFDYMSCAKPIILGIEGVAAELVKTANCGIVVEPENVLEFVKAVELLYNDRNLANELGRNGLEFVKKYFSRQALSEQYLVELERLVTKITY